MKTYLMKVEIDIEVMAENEEEAEDFVLRNLPNDEIESMSGNMTCRYEDSGRITSCVEYE